MARLLTIALIKVAPATMETITLRRSLLPAVQDDENARCRERSDKHFGILFEFNMTALG
jgi:hypothetical protein